MKNKYIEVVKRWLGGEDVSHEALKANAAAKAYAAAAAKAYAAAAAYVADAAAAWAARADDDAAAAARVAAYVAADWAAYAAYWVKRYEEMTDEKNNKPNVMPWHNNI